MLPGDSGRPGGSKPWPAIPTDTELRKGKEDEGVTLGHTDLSVAVQDGVVVRELRSAMKKRKRERF
jgi:hypothetical protein